MTGGRGPIRTLTVVIPVYNEEATIGAIVDEVCAVALPDLHR
jgi:hypothetical protein